MKFLKRKVLKICFSCQKDLYANCYSLEVFGKNEIFKRKSFENMLFMSKRSLKSNIKKDHVFQ